MLTDVYTASLYGVDSEFYTVQFVAYLWEQSANKEYQNSGIFVPSLIEVNKIVCGKIRGCNLGDTAHLITVLRNPADSVDIDELEFRNSFFNVLNEVRMKLDNPYMTLRADKTDIILFEHI